MTLVRESSSRNTGAFPDEVNAILLELYNRSGANQLGQLVNLPAGALSAADSEMVGADSSVLSPTHSFVSRYRCGPFLKNSSLEPRPRLL